MVKRRWLLGLLLAVGAVGFVRLAPQAGPLRATLGLGAPPTTQATAPDGASDASRVARPASAPRAAQAPPRPVPMELPPPDAPLAAVMPALVRAARAGDPGAMCRLAFEMMRCGPNLEGMRRREAEYTDMLVYAEPEADAKSGLLGLLARNTAKREALEAICAGVVLPADLKPWRLLRDAARAGHVPSMVRFGANFPLEFDHMLDDLDALASYRDDRLGFLEQAAAQGNAKAAYAAFSEFSGNGGMFGGGARRDPVRALAYALAIERVGNADTLKGMARQTTMLRHKLSQADLREAERLAATLAPNFATVDGSQADLRLPLSASGADCGAEDAKTLLLEPRRDAAGNPLR
jgi:hypothetical protein